VADLADYLDLTVSQGREQFRALLARRPVSGGRQVTFLPAETLLCLAASFLVNHRHYGGSTAHQAPEPVPALARLFSRPPSSVLAKMANLDGSRSHGARWDALAGAILRDDPARFTATYRLLLAAARAEGIGLARLPVSRPNPSCRIGHVCVSAFLCAGLVDHSLPDSVGENLTGRLIHVCGG
jgi:putative restriction endonuclease